MFVLVGVDVGFLTKGLGGKKISVFGGGRCWFMRTTWEAKSMRGIRTLQPDQSVIADTLALKASSWFRQNLARGESTGCPLLVSGVRHLRLSANMGLSSSLVPHDKKGFEHAPVKR